MSTYTICNNKYNNNNKHAEDVTWNLFTGVSNPDKSMTLQKSLTKDLKKKYTNYTTTYVLNKTT